MFVKVRFRFLKSALEGLRGGQPDVALNLEQRFPAGHFDNYLLAGMHPADLALLSPHFEEIVLAAPMQLEDAEN